MNADKIIKLANRYYEELVKGGADPAKMDERKVITVGFTKISEDHLAWACLQVKKYVNDNDQLVLAQQWIGFIQGALWQLGFYSIEEMRQHDVEGNGESNLPDEPDA